MESMSSIALQTLLCALSTLLRCHSLRRRLCRTLFSELIHAALFLLLLLLLSAVHAVCGVNERLNYSQIASLTTLRPSLLPFLRLITKTNHKYLAKSQCVVLSLCLSMSLTRSNNVCKYDIR